MKMPKRLIASLGVLMLSATPLLHASADQRDDHAVDKNATPLRLFCFSEWSKNIIIDNTCPGNHVRRIG